MKSLQDALYNWLTIKVVADARMDDTAAQDTADIFLRILRNEHHIHTINVEREELMYLITYQVDENEKTVKFPTELIDVMLNQMIDEPEKFKNYPNK
ncbi:hypothetical protein ACFFIX_25465 [Metabacillus herbersteinensis]|uniref:Uncharacterized protein n=1 Tax=Metabacillus herbersteinensis TaxID=283816 RepID=A0ABV6GM58_9BACI